MVHGTYRGYGRRRARMVAARQAEVSQRSIDIETTLPRGRVVAWDRGLVAEGGFEPPTKGL